MAEGYTLKLANDITSADKEKLGVRLGLFCLERDIPVSAVAEAVGVSRQTVYHWFVGSRIPRQTHEQLINNFISKG